MNGRERARFAFLCCIVASSLAACGGGGTSGNAGSAPGAPLANAAQRGPDGTAVSTATSTTNAPSLRVVAKCGGVMHDEIPLPEDPTVINRRFWIQTGP